MSDFVGVAAVAGVMHSVVKVLRELLVQCLLPSLHSGSFLVLFYSMGFFLFIFFTYAGKYCISDCKKEIAHPS